MRLSLSLQLDLDFTQVKKLVARLPQQKMETLTRYLDDQTLFEQMRRVQRELKSAPITMEEITAEVKAVKKAGAMRTRGPFRQEGR